MIDAVTGVGRLSRKRLCIRSSIPRGLSVDAGGEVHITEKGKTVFNVMAAADYVQWPIIQSPFLQQKAKTLSYEQQLSVFGCELNYHQKILVDIYGCEFAHTDDNTLIRFD